MRTKSGSGQCALTFGYDQRLTSTRQRLLEKAGCKSLVALSLSELHAALVNNVVDLVILCQTIPADACLSALELVSEHAPAAQMLVMHNRRDYCQPKGNYVLLESMSGPETFVRTASRMLSEARIPAAVLVPKRLFSAAPR